MDLLCVGHAAWDISVFVPEYPAENSKCEVRTMIECGGGPAANAACLLSRWGVSCALAAMIGEDEYGDRIVREFTGVGTDLTLVQRRADCPTPVSVILVNEQTGSRTIVNRKSAGDRPLLKLSQPGWSQSPRVLLFDGHELDASLEAMAMFPQAKTILDAGSLRAGTKELARRVDYLVSSERFARQLSGLSDLESPENQSVAIRALHQYNGRPVVITCGERGLLHGTGERFETLPAFPAKTVDTTGAGDIFHGAFAYGVLKQRPWRETLRLASAAAAVSVTARGGRTSIPSLNQVEETMDHAG